MTGDVKRRLEAVVAENRDADLEVIIAARGLKHEEARAFVDAASRDGAVPTASTAASKKQIVLARLVTFFDCYFALV